MEAKNQNESKESLLFQAIRLVSDCPRGINIIKLEYIEYKKLHSAELSRVRYKRIF